MTDKQMLGSLITVVRSLIMILANRGFIEAVTASTFMDSLEKNKKNG